MKVKLAEIKHVYFTSVSARCTFAVVYINGSQIVISGPLVVLYVLGGPVANYKYILKISLNLCFKFILVYLLLLNQNVRINIFKL